MLPITDVTLRLELTNLYREVLDVIFVLLTDVVYFLHGVTNLHCTRSHFVHAIGDDSCEPV